MQPHFLRKCWIRLVGPGRQVFILKIGGSNPPSSTKRQLKAVSFFISPIISKSRIFAPSKPKIMKIEFLGATTEVTGSKFLLTTRKGVKILLDCGMYQGKGLETDRMNRDLGFDPREIDYIILSHAHIDHSGLIPCRIICIFAPSKIIKLFSNKNLHLWHLFLKELAACRRQKLLQ